MNKCMEEITDRDIKIMLMTVVDTLRAYDIQVDDRRITACVMSIILTADKVKVIPDEAVTQLRDLVSAFEEHRRSVQ